MKNYLRRVFYFQQTSRILALLFAALILGAVPTLRGFFFIKKKRRRSALLIQ